MAYDPGRFSDIAHSSLGGRIQHFVRRHENLVRLETTTDLGRPAAEGLARVLLNEFGDDVRADRVKQFIGHFIRHVLEQRGFALHAQGVRVRTGGLFTVATRYRRL